MTTCERIAAQVGKVSPHPEWVVGSFNVLFVEENKKVRKGKLINGKMDVGRLSPHLVLPLSLGGCLLKVCLFLSNTKGKRFGIAPVAFKGAWAEVKEEQGIYHVVINLPGMTQAQIDGAKEFFGKIDAICPVHNTLDKDCVAPTQFVGHLSGKHDE